MLNYKKRLAFWLTVSTSKVSSSLMLKRYHQLGNVCRTGHARLRSIHTYRNPFRRQTFPMFIVETLIDKHLLVLLIQLIQLSPY